MLSRHNERTWIPVSIIEVISYLSVGEKIAGFFKQICFPLVIIFSCSSTYLAKLFFLKVGRKMHFLSR